MADLRLGFSSAGVAAAGFMIGVKVPFKTQPPWTPAPLAAPFRKPAPSMSYENAEKASEGLHFSLLFPLQSCEIDKLVASAFVIC